MESELELQCLELQTKREKLDIRVKIHAFDVSKHVNLVPPFVENNVEKYFIHFEKVVTTL